jgi:uncharacterized membrane protein (UPF0127 family)
MNNGIFGALRVMRMQGKRAFICGLMISMAVALMAIVPGVATAEDMATGAAAPVNFQRQSAQLIKEDGTVYALSVEYAGSDRQREHGLMYRRSLPAGEGMLFDFEQPMRVRMWMKNTLIPLDMLFFDQDGRVVFIVENAQPGDLTPVGPAEPVVAVLELPGGQAKSWHLGFGDRLTHPMFMR